MRVKGRRYFGPFAKNAKPLPSCCLMLKPMFDWRSEAVVKLLLDAKADVDIKDRNGGTPLFLAVYNNNRCETLVELLLNAEADVNLLDKADRTPLSITTKKGHEAVIKLLHSAASKRSQ
jgi:ankyrin repeat protein